MRGKAEPLRALIGNPLARTLRPEVRQVLLESAQSFLLQVGQLLCGHGNLGPIEPCAGVYPDRKESEGSFFLYRQLQRLCR
jgi:hypothetical protein